MKYNYVPGHFWIRTSEDGPGLLIKDTRRHPLIFSQRQGYTRGLHIGWLWIQWLPRRMLRDDLQDLRAQCSDVFAWGNLRSALFAAAQRVAAAGAQAACEVPDPEKDNQPCGKEIIGIWKHEKGSTLICADCRARLSTQTKQAE